MLISKTCGSQSRLTDAKIRRVIHLEIIPSIVGDSPSRVIDEMAISCGEARIDIAVINGKLHGFEIKSEVDTLARLDGQVNAYNQIFDTMTIICGKNHYDAIVEIVPYWWGVYTAAYHLGAVDLTKMRFAELNPQVSGMALAQLLWKPELIALLGQAGIKKGVSNKPCRDLWKIVSDTFSTPMLQTKVREILKFRECWRLDLQQT